MARSARPRPARRPRPSTRTDLRKLGPTTRGWLSACGLSDADALQSDPIALGIALRAAGFPFSLNGCYALAAMKLGCDWRALPASLREDLRARWLSARGRG